MACWRESAKVGLVRRMDGMGEEALVDVRIRIRNLYLFRLRRQPFWVVQVCRARRRRQDLLKG